MTEDKVCRVKASEACCYESKGGNRHFYLEGSDSALDLISDCTTVLRKIVLMGRMF